MPEACVFCEIASGSAPAAIVYQDAQTLALLDQRQFHPGHVLVIPRRHLTDIRELDEAIGAALMATLTRITRAVARAFPCDGLSIWHSIGAAAGQEVFHLHLHVHPRRVDDQLLRVYPARPDRPDLATLQDWAARLQAQL